MTDIAQIRESQTVAKCSELRQDCRADMFDKMDDNHRIQMNELGDIKEEIAYRKGQEEVRFKNIIEDDKKKKNWRDIGIKLLVNWGPWIALFLIIGSTKWLKAKGWL